VIGCGFRVANELGAGFLEKFYENALVHEVRKAGLGVSQQHPVTVLYDGVVVDDDAVDLLVERVLLVDVRSVRQLDGIHTAQCLNYLKATGLHLGLLLNCGTPRVEIKRIAL
jgi:GxxExxY protein